MSAESDVQAIIDQALAIGVEKSADASNYADQAITASQGYVFGNTNLVDFTPANVEPPVYIPTTASGLDTALYNSTYDKIIKDLSDQFAAFFAKYFPDECDYIGHAQEWICKALTEGGTGINASVEDQIWQRARARILSDVNRASEDVTATFAARRFPFPPGALQHQLNLTQRDGQDRIAELNRDAAIKQIDVEVENVRFAVQQALAYRVQGISAAADYIRALAIAPNIAATLTTSQANAQAQLINAASSYYNARIKIEEIKLDVKKTNARETNDIQRVELHEFSNRLTSQVQVLAAAATAAGNQASAALNTVHAAAQISAQGELT